MIGNNNDSLHKLSSGAVQALRSSKHDEAIEITSAIIERQADHAPAHAVQFSALFKTKRFEQARKMGTKAAKLNPKSEFILNNQACLQLEAKQPAAAAGLLKSLIEQFGERAQWLYNLALAQRMVGNYEYAITMFRRTLDHQAEHDRAAFQLADCLTAIGHQEEALQAYEYVRILRNKHAPSHSNFIHHAAANGGLDRVGLSQELGLWESRFIPNDKRYPIEAPNNINQLNVAFLIGVLPSEWLLSTVAPLINELALGTDQVTVYWHDAKLPSGVFNDQVKIVFCASMSDAEFARRGRTDNIEVLIDVCGMRIGARQRALGLQLAAKEYGWLAHEGQYATSIVEILDRKLGDQRFYVGAPATPYSELPEKTFSGIGSQSGLSYQVIKTWAQLLRELPDWKLHLDANNRLVNALLKKRFEAHGIKSDRLIFGGSVGPTQHTIVLDNYIQNDPIAAANALASGGVLVTLHGELFPARQNTALLRQLNREHWVSKNLQQYVKRALSLANSKDENAVPLDDADLKRSGLRNLGLYVNHFRTTIAR